MKAYPDLKSDATMLQAQQTYNEVEAQISVARRFYNSSVAELNNSIEIFPGNLLSELANSKIMPFFEAEESALQPVKAAALLS
jgi:LemA protein